MATFVLVHGGWVGGWFWRRVGNALREAGHYVIAPTLTGCGERKHLGTPETDLETHILDVVHAMEYEDVARVVLAGHGYGGMVVTGALDRAAHRVYHAAYVDAFVPENGQSIGDLRGALALEQYQQAAKMDGWHIPVPFRAEAMGITAEVDLRWMMHRFTPQPLQPFLTPLVLRATEPLRVPRSFIRCTMNSPEWVPAMEAKARAAKMAMLQIDAPHYAPVTHPKEIAALLVKMAPGG